MIQKNLISWFKKEQRALPWRETYDPYQVWISEIMLQQTQVATVLPYFERFMKALPTLSALAEADENTLLKLWEGLGYYSRAHNLQKAARIVLNEHGGVFPDSYEAILTLPGIGPYTAGAICSIAYNQDRPIVDGNIVRVISRLDDFREEVKGNMPYFWKRAEELLPKGDARLFNQGLMELGALVCTPKSPRCSVCPLNEFCKARAIGSAEDLPNKGPSRSKIKVRVAIAILEKDGKIFVQKRRDSGLMAGLWEFPGGKVEKKESFEAALHREVLEETGFQIQNPRFFMNLQHAYTRYVVDLHCYTAEVSDGMLALTAATEARWVKPEELKAMPFPAANVKIIDRYLEIQANQALPSQRDDSIPQMENHGSKAQD